jgi:hypothetical protein
MHRPRSYHVPSRSSTPMFLVPIPKAPYLLWVSTMALTAAFLAAREGKLLHLGVLTLCEG